MAYLNANIPVTYAQIKREYLYDLKKHHGEVEDCIIFGLSAITGRSIYSMQLWRMALSFIGSQYLPSYREVLNRKMFLNVDLMNFSYGIVLVIILLLLVGIF